MSKKRQRPASLNRMYVNNDYKRKCVGNSFLDRNRQKDTNNNNYTRNNNQYQQHPSFHHQLNNANYHNVNSQYRPPLPPQQKVYATSYTQNRGRYSNNYSNNTFKIDNKNYRKIRACTYGDKCFNEKCKFDHPNGKNRTGLIEKRVKYKVEAKASGNMFIDQQKLTDPKKIQQRKKQIDLGKDTKGYYNYIRLIPKHKRSRDYKVHPRTPDHTQAISNRNWQGQTRVWREALHKFDDVIIENENFRIYPLSRKINEIIQVGVGDIFPSSDSKCDIIYGPTLRPGLYDSHETVLAEIEQDILI